MVSPSAAGAVVAFPIVNNEAHESKRDELPFFGCILERRVIILYFFY